MSRKRYTLDRTVELLCLNSDSDDMDASSESDSSSDESCDNQESVLQSTFREFLSFLSDLLSPAKPTDSSVTVPTAVSAAAASVAASASASASATVPTPSCASLQWKFVNEYNDARSELPSFLGIPGLRTEFEESVLSNLDDDEIFRNVIKCFITDELIETLVKFTNIRAALYLRTETIKPQSRFKSWTDCSSAEMKKFVGLVLLMGIVRKPQLTDYWSTDDILCTPVFHSESSLTRDRFLLILHFIRFANYEDLGSEENCLRKNSTFC